jgi:hypothetical protein
VSVAAFEAWRLRDGRCAEHWLQLDLLGAAATRGSAAARAGRTGWGRRIAALNEFQFERKLTDVNRASPVTTTKAPAREQGRDPGSPEMRAVCDFGNSGEYPRTIGPRRTDQVERLGIRSRAAAVVLRVG